MELQAKVIPQVWFEVRRAVAHLGHPQWLGSWARPERLARRPPQAQGVVDEPSMGDAQHRGLSERCGQAVYPIHGLSELDPERRRLEAADFVRLPVYRERAQVEGESQRQVPTKRPWMVSCQGKCRHRSCGAVSGGTRACPCRMLVSLLR